MMMCKGWGAMAAAEMWERGAAALRASRWHGSYLPLTPRRVGPGHGMQNVIMLVVAPAVPSGAREQRGASPPSAFQFAMTRLLLIMRADESSVCFGGVQEKVASPIGLLLMEMRGRGWCWSAASTI